MIEVTDEMITKVVNYFNTTANDTPDDRVWLYGAIKLIIELHEANKPKPEPVGKIVKYDCSHFAEGDWDKYPIGTILYATPPTQEPLTIEEVSRILSECRKGTTMF